MSSSVIAVEWRNQNALRNFPFREDCSLRPNDSAGNLISDGWRLPNYLLVDLVIGVNMTSFDPTIYLKRLSYVNGTATLTFADGNGEDAFTAAASVSNSDVTVVGTGSYANSRGTVCFGDLQRFSEEVSDGIYTFEKEESLIEPTCIRPSAQGIRSLYAEDENGYVSAKLQGDIKLVAGENIRLEYLEYSHAIVISADSNSGYSSTCTCKDDEYSVVRTINGINTENVTIVGDDCVSVETKDGVIRISDSCSKPCCGCAETAFINQSINDLQSSVNTLTTNTSILADRVTNFVNNFLLARKTLS